MKIREEFFYISKDCTDIKPINNSIINISYSITFYDYYHVYINYKLLNRFIKINKLTNGNKINDILDLIHLCESYRINFDDILEKALVKELSKEINKDILKNIRNLKK